MWSPTSSFSGQLFRFVYVGSLLRFLPDPTSVYLIEVFAVDGFHVKGRSYSQYLVLAGFDDLVGLEMGLGKPLF